MSLTVNFGHAMVVPRYFRANRGEHHALGDAHVVRSLLCTRSKRVRVVRECLGRGTRGRSDGNSRCREAPAPARWHEASEIRRRAVTCSPKTGPVFWGQVRPSTGGGSCSAARRTSGADTEEQLH